MIQPFPQPEATLGDLRQLRSLELWLERQCWDGPCSKWDAELLDRWRSEVRAQIIRVELVLERRMKEPSLRERFAQALRREVVVHLNAGDIGTPAFERFVQVLDQSEPLYLFQRYTG